MAFAKHSKGATCEGCLDRLKEAHPYLGEWFKYRKQRFPTMHISWAHRDQAWQEKAFREGASKLEWPKSKHNSLPAEALDIFQIDDDGKAVFDPVFCAKVWDDTKKNGYTNMRWGGEFARLKDFNHFEMNSDSASGPDHSEGG